MAGGRGPTKGRHGHDKSRAADGARAPAQSRSRASTRLATCRDESRVGCADGDEGLADAADFDGTFLLGVTLVGGFAGFPGPSDDRSFVSAGSRSGSGQGSQPGSDVVALTRSPGFWRLMGYAALFGVVLAFASLAFLGLVKGGTNLWFTLPKNPGWLDGSLWWVAVTAAAGVLVGVLRRLFRLPVKMPGTVEELKDQRVEPSTVLKAVAVSAGVAGRRCEPRARGRTGEDGGRAGNLGLGAEEAQRGHASDEHAHRNVRSVRWPVVGSDFGDDSGA